MRRGLPHTGIGITKIKRDDLNVRTIYLLILALLLCSVVVLNPCLAQEYTAGVEYDAVLPGSGNVIKVHVPANYEPSRKWPLVVFYHGMNGSPTTDCITRHCQGRDFIVAGITYCEKLESHITREQHNAYIERERGNFRSAVLWVKQNLSLDINRVFLGGVSQGGWTTSLVGERELKNLAGLIILLAGRQRDVVPVSQKMNGFSVYIGAGEEDPNLISALHAAGFYRYSGATVLFEEFANIGHQVPQKGEMLALWLEAHGPLRHPWLDAEAIGKQRAAYKKQYEAALELSDQTALCHQLKALLDDPRLEIACGLKTCQAIESKMNLCAKSSPGFLKQLTAERVFYDLVGKEWCMTTIEATAAVVDGYSKLQNFAPGSKWAGYAQRSHARLVPVYHSALKQQGEIKSQRKSTPRPPAKTSFDNFGRRGGTSL